ncbi:hypothetical protein [Zoogloea sp. LCSB751]|uniref:hypothetical protein n=1 Tax=Zoogloea sp. LCSB751 TaxID=1965277 RepID=UPI0009A50241|nr:hypothetical protein [Zoogloea sp. LCSB751]
MRMVFFLLGAAAAAWSGGVAAEVANLCRAGEHAVWSCRAGTKYYSLCASRSLGEREGYLQYRAGWPSRTVFRFPGRLTHPRGHFRFGLLAHGARVTFERGAYRYEIIEDLKGDTSIFVQLPAGKTTQIDCADAMQTLTENTTIDLFKSAGVAE